jgi:phospholipid/cholesterol/gamma-HCH transport system substrate-binding protein
MASIKTKFVVGLFVTAGLTFAAAAVVWLGMSHYLEKGQYYAAYFDESVQGLDRDSPVKYRGVSIGRVYSVTVAPDVRLIEVILKIEPVLENPELLVATLKSVGITGIMYVELDRRESGDKIQLPNFTFTPDYPVIATQPSDIQKLFASVETAVSQFGKLNIGNISTKIEETLDEINGTLKTLSLGPLSNSLNASAERLQHILDEKKWDRLIKSLTVAGDSVNAFGKNGSNTFAKLDQALVKSGPVLQNTLSKVDTALVEVGNLLGRLNTAASHADGLLQTGQNFIHRTDDRLEDLERSLNVSLGNLESATQTLNQILDTIAGQPSQIIFGAPVQERSPSGR